MGSKKKEISQEEIAKQFLLPERQSKIATLLKQDGQAYCICRSSDSSRFMIGCDSCEEWYHGDCINITEKESKLIKQFFCVRCREEDPTLQTRWKTRRRDDPSLPADERKAKRRKERDENAPKLKSGSKRCGQCMGCYRADDCGRCDACKDMKKHGGSSRLKLRCKQRVCVNSLQRRPERRRRRHDSSSDGGDGDHHHRHHHHHQPQQQQQVRQQHPQQPPPHQHHQVAAHLLTDVPRHCLGPGCVNSARHGSKYCSDACGTKLATNRIYQVLPQRIQEWALSPCEAEEKNKRALDLVRRQQQEVRRVLHELDERHRELDALVERARCAAADPALEADAHDEPEPEMSMYCITCGHEIHSRTAVKHMEKCFNKYESQASFGSVFKTRIEGNNMFCDFYNAANRTYCKRLRVLCPEHCKDPKVADGEVCGCPLVADVFSVTGDFCRALKKSCTRHHVWEKLRRAEVDMERVRQWLKMDELMEQERQLRHSMAARAGVLALMLHSTYNHELMERLTQASQHDQEAVREHLAKRFRKTLSRQAAPRSAV